VSGFPPLVVDTEVERDPIQPGVQGGVALEAVEALVRFGERVLDDVQRVLTIAEHACCESRHFALIPFHQHAERLSVTLSSPLDELAVIGRHRVLVGLTGHGVF